MAVTFLQVRNVRPAVMQDLESCLAQQAPPAQPDNPALHELPPLVIDGIPTPVDKMTQVHCTGPLPIYKLIAAWKCQRLKNIYTLQKLEEKCHRPHTHTLNQSSNLLY